MEQPAPQRSTYYRDYQRKKWLEDPIGKSAYQRTLRLRKNNKDIPEVELQTFGKYLANVVKIRKLLAEMPPELRTAAVPQQQG